MFELNISPEKNKLFKIQNGGDLKGLNYDFYFKKFY